jgi:hypothetical protein
MEANCSAWSGWAFHLGRPAACSIVVSIPACHAEEPGSIPGGGVLFRIGNMGGDAPSMFVVALSCYDLWLLGKSMRVLDFEMLIRCFTFEGKLTDRFNWQRDIDD